MISSRANGFAAFIIDKFFWEEVENLKYIFNLNLDGMMIQAVKSRKITQSLLTYLRSHLCNKLRYASAHLC